MHPHEHCQNELFLQESRSAKVEKIQTIATNNRKIVGYFLIFLKWFQCWFKHLAGNPTILYK
jgi:hypothetical protein